MAVRAACALLAIAAFSARAQEASIFVDVEPTTDDVEDVEKRYTPELETELQSAKDDALLLYTEFSGRAGLELKIFLKEMTGFADRTVRSMDDRLLIGASQPCRNELERKLRKIENDATLAASYSGVNHHKFLLGHMIVFKMHLNKSEDYIRKCDSVISKCGRPCETTARVRRWRRHAANELHRVQDDLQHSRRSYKDLVTHAHRHLKHLRRQAARKAHEAIEDFKKCS